MPNALIGSPRDLPALRPQPKRSGRDWWPTPPCLTAALVDRVLPELPPASIWEPAAGDGRLADAMRTSGYSVLASDLVPRVDMMQHDFLHDPPPAETCGSIVVTNPPYNQLDAFFRRGLELLDSGILTALVLLTRIDATMAKRRISALNRAAILWQCNWRTVWIPGTKTGPRW